MVSCLPSQGMNPIRISAHPFPFIKRVIRLGHRIRIRQSSDWDHGALTEGLKPEAFLAMQYVEPQIFLIPSSLSSQAIVFSLSALPSVTVPTPAIAQVGSRLHAVQAPQSGQC